MVLHRQLPGFARRARIALPFFSILLVLPLSACETHQQTGAVIGTVVGAALGVGTAVLIGDAESGFALGGIIGAGIGGMLGSKIGMDLDEAERQQAMAAAQEAASQPAGARVKWESPTRQNVGGYATPVAAEEYETATICRKIRHVVFTPEGEATEEDYLCRNGQWVPT